MAGYGGMGGYGGHGMGGRGMGRGGSEYGDSSSYGGRGGGRGGFRPEHDFVEGKLFLGGLDTQTTKETLVEYCTQWQVPCKTLMTDLTDCGRKLSMCFGSIISFFTSAL